MVIQIYEWTIFTNSSRLWTIGSIFFKEEPFSFMEKEIFEIAENQKKYFWVALRLDETWLDDMF